MLLEQTLLRLAEPEQKRLTVVYRGNHGFPIVETTTVALGDMGGHWGRQESWPEPPNDMIIESPVRQKNNRAFGYQFPPEYGRGGPVFRSENLQAGLTDYGATPKNLSSFQRPSSTFPSG
jgi:lipoprotein-anchoring transpeptidase ErfK/SrfK